MEGYCIPRDAHCDISYSSLFRHTAQIGLPHTYIMTFATLRALNAVIGSAIDEMERVYRAQHTPIDYPSLDEPYYTTAQHTPDEELAENLKADPVVAAASKRIVAACGQLSTTVNKPWLGLTEDVQAGQFAECLRFMENAHIVEILREAGPSGMHVDEICKLALELRPKTKEPINESPLTSSKLGHILRLLATYHYLREVKRNVFANNRPSSFIDSGKSVTQLRETPENKYKDTDGIAATVGFVGDEAIKFCACLTDWALPDLIPTFGPIDVNFAHGIGTSGTELAQALNKKTRATWYAPFNLAFNTQLGYFEWLELPENAGRLERFGHAMTGTCQYETKETVLKGFSWDELPQGAVLIDVGGGIGSTSIRVAEAYPHIRVVVEDRAAVVANAVSAWGSQYQQLFKSGRVSYRERNFFESWQPLTLPDTGIISSPSVFMVRLILHDWADKDARKILAQLRAAAGPHTKLLIGDMLLPYACRDINSASTETAFERADEAFIPEDSPLLPNLGKANIHGYLLDIMMMGMFNAKERMVDEMAALAFSAGWKVTEVRRDPGSMWAYTTAVPV